MRGEYLTIIKKNYNEAIHSSGYKNEHKYFEAKSYQNNRDNNLGNNKTNNSINI